MFGRRFNCERSTNYRQAFFRTHKPFVGDIYFCAYCGFPHRRRKITIDHLYPIHKAQNSRRLRKKLMRKNYRDINDPQNLVPACESCNKRKGAKISWWWVLKGRVGSVQWLWIPRHALRMWILYTIFKYAISVLQI